MNCTCYELSHVMNCHVNSINWDGYKLSPLWIDTAMNCPPRTVTLWIILLYMVVDFKQNTVLLAHCLLNRFFPWLNNVIPLSDRRLSRFSLVPLTLTTIDPPPGWSWQKIFCTCRVIEITIVHSCGFFVATYFVPSRDIHTERRYAFIFISMYRFYYYSIQMGKDPT